MTPRTPRTSAEGCSPSRPLPCCSARPTPILVVTAPPHVPLLAFTKPQHPSGPALQDTLLYSHTHMHTHSHKLTQTRRVRNMCTHLHAPCTSHRVAHTRSHGAFRGPYHTCTHAITYTHVHTHTRPSTHTHIRALTDAHRSVLRSFPPHQPGRPTLTCTQYTHVETHMCTHLHARCTSHSHKHTRSTHLTRAAAHTYPYSHITHLNCTLSHLLTTTHTHISSLTHTRSHTLAVPPGTLPHAQSHTHLHTCAHTTIRDSASLSACALLMNSKWLRDGGNGRERFCPCPLPLPHAQLRGPGRSPLTGMVWLPCRAWMAAWASVWEENFTKAQPGPRQGARVRGNRVFLGREGPQVRALGAPGGGSDGQNRQPARQLDNKGSGSKKSTQSMMSARWPLIRSESHQLHRCWWLAWPDRHCEAVCSPEEGQVLPAGTSEGHGLREHPPATSR